MANSHQKVHKELKNEVIITMKGGQKEKIEEETVITIEKVIEKEVITEIIENTIEKVEEEEETVMIVVTDMEEMKEEEEVIHIIQGEIPKIQGDQALHTTKAVTEEVRETEIEEDPIMEPPCTTKVEVETMTMETDQDQEVNNDCCMTLRNTYLLIFKIN